MSAATKNIARGGTAKLASLEAWDMNPTTLTK